MTVYENALGFSLPDFPMSGVCKIFALLCALCAPALYAQELKVQPTPFTVWLDFRAPQNLAAALMTVEQVPDIPMFRKNTAAFVHEMPAAGVANVDGDSTYVRVQVLTNAGALDRDKQLAAVARLTAVVADAAGDPSLADRTWVLLTEAPDGGWGLAGHANTNEELIAAARAEIAKRTSETTE